MNNHFKKPRVTYDYSYLKEHDLEGKTTLESIQKVSPMLNDMNPLTYSIYLAMNDKILTDAEKTYYAYMIRAMMQYEKETMEEVSKIMKSKEEYKLTKDDVETIN
jgi:hypothetical protein